MSHRGKFMSNLFEQLAIVKEELRKLEEMMHGNMLQLPWDKAPEWAQWMVMDKFGTWFWIENEPNLVDIPEPLWDTTGRWSIFTFLFPPCTNWKESKRKRP